MAGDNGNALLQFEPGLMIWTVVTFLVTFLALRLIAWKPILGVLDEREGRIRESLQKAEQAQAEAERAIEENKASLEASLRQSQELVAEARQEAERVRTQARDLQLKTVADGIIIRVLSLQPEQRRIKLNSVCTRIGVRVLPRHRPQVVRDVSRER